MRSHQLTFAQMAVRLSISHAALRITCDKNGNPGTKLLPRLADVLSITESQLKQLVLENELAQIQQRNS